MHSCDLKYSVYVLKDLFKGSVSQIFNLSINFLEETVVVIYSLKWYTVHVLKGHIFTI